MENMQMEPRIKILIADESEKFRADLKENLSKYGVEFVEETSDGTDVYSKIKRTNPDVVLIDVWLPKLDAIQIIRKTNQLYNGSTQPPEFIVFSCCSNPNLFEEATEAGAAYCMQKPKMAPHLSAMRENIASVLQMEIDDINIKATTEEKLGFTGRGEGISAHAVCLLQKA